MGKGVEGNSERSCRKTQRQPDEFAKQCATRKYKSNDIKYVMTDISSETGVSTHSSKTINELWESRGRYTIHFCKTNNRGLRIGGDKVFWHDSKREKMQLKVSDLLIFAIRRYRHVNGFTDEFKVSRYTTFKVYDNASDKSVKYDAN
jgi:hypothetical protein